MADGQRPPAPDIDQVVAEWRCVLDQLLARSDVGEVPVGYYGLSMGCRHGLPLIATEPRIAVAVLGLLSGQEPRVMAAAEEVH